MATTTNFGWETPDDTDLVKDGASAIRTLGSAIDTSLVDLKGGTTGQVLAKASNTDMDFTWATDASGIPATIFDAKGDIIAASAADTAARLAVGTNGQVLTADSTASTGLKWASASSAKNFSLLNTGGTALTGATSITISGISGIDELHIIYTGASSANASSWIQLQLNGQTTGYYSHGFKATGSSSYSQGTLVKLDNSNDTAYYLTRMSTGANSAVSGYARISGCNTTGTKVIHHAAGANQGTGDSQENFIGGGYVAISSAISSVTLVSTTGNFDAGTIYVYGA